MRHFDTNFHLIHSKALLKSTLGSATNTLVRTLVTLVTFLKSFRSLCSCNNFAECHILAEDFDFGPNPCPDTERYLEASYVCVPRSQNYEGKTIKKSLKALPLSFLSQMQWQ